MSKYTEQFKCSVVEHYFSEANGYRSAAAHFGLDYGTVRRWVFFFRFHGADGLKKKFNYYTATFKLAVLQYRWKHELSHCETAAVFNIRNPPSLAEWERRYHLGGIDALDSAPRGRPKKMPDSPPKKPLAPPDAPSRTREELLAEVNYLRMENAYLKKLKALVQAQRQAVPKKRK